MESLIKKMFTQFYKNVTVLMTLKKIVVQIENVEKKLLLTNLNLCFLWKIVTFNVYIFVV